MVKIGLISDTHGFLDTRVKDVFKEVDEIWHAGDIGSLDVIQQLSQTKKVLGVFGNIDGREIRMEFPENLFFEREGLQILITHIGGYPNNYAPKARKLIEEHKPDIFICGHSHILKVMRDEKNRNMLAMNPGAAGNQGFHKVKTVMRFDLDKGAIKHLEVVELGKRGEIM